MIRSYLIAGLLSLSSAFGQGPTKDQIIKEVKLDLAESLKKLNTQRSIQLGAKAELAKKFNSIEQQLINKRRQFKLSQMSTADQAAVIRELVSAHSGSADEIKRLSKMLKVYGIQFQTKLLPGELYTQQLAGVFSQEQDPNIQLEQRFSAIEAGIDRLDSMLGGTVIKAQATDAESRVIEGKVAVVGPLRWFESDNKQSAGSLTLSKSGTVASLDSSQAEQAREIISGKDSMASIDLTGGKAKALDAIKNTPLALIKKGGAWVFPILGLALIALVCALIKLAQLLQVRQPSAGFIREFLNVDSEEQQRSLLAKLRHPLAVVLPHCIAAKASGAEVVEEVLYEQLIDVRDKLRGWLPFISITAATAPLLGLLGTVSGLIRTFNIITVEGTGEAQSFAGGISEALITTMFGLIVAIPAFILHALLSRKAKGIEQTTEKLGLGYVNGLRKLKKE